MQIRERDLGSRELARLVRNALRAIVPPVRLLVNDRTDIAIACGAHGVHLRSDSVAVEAARRISPPGFTVSVACHGLEDLRSADRQRADLALLSPIYAVPGKNPPLGLEALRHAAQLSSIPVLALGGISGNRIEECASAGAAGIAGIRLFQDPACRAPHRNER